MATMVLSEELQSEILTETSSENKGLLMNNSYKDENIKQLEFIEEEEEEEEEVYYLPQQQVFDLPQTNYFYDYPTEEGELNQMDEPFYLANKTFYTTCHKISRQNNPSYRKKPPYSLLENWLIHSIFSKSQQILLRFPVIHPRVMMAEGDFIYTPHQIANDYNNQPNEQTTQDGDTDPYYYYDNNNTNTNNNNLVNSKEGQNIQPYNQHLDYDYQEDEEEDYDYYDDTFIIGDEGVMVMSASAPDASHFITEEDEEDLNLEIKQSSASLIMDENMWMGHSRYNNNGLTLHVVNPDTTNEDEDDPMYHNNPYKSFVYNNSNFQGQLQMVQEEDEEDEEDYIQQEIKENNLIDDLNSIDPLNSITKEINAQLQSINEPQKSSKKHEDSIPLEKQEYKTTPLSMSPEVLEWYRTADLRSLSTPIVVNSQEEKLVTQCGCSSNNANNLCLHLSDNQSESSTTSSNSTKSRDMHTLNSDEKTVSHHSTFPSLTEGMIEEQASSRIPIMSYGTLSSTVHEDTPNIPSLMRVSVCFVDAAWVALDLAQNYVESSDTKGITSFVSCMFRICKVLFLGAESMLGWRNQRSKPQTVV